MSLIHIVSVVILLASLHLLVVLLLTIIISKSMESSENLFNLIKNLEERVKQLEEENIENTNLIYEVMNSIEAVDRRIDIVAESPWKEQFE